MQQSLVHNYKQQKQQQQQQVITEAILPRHCPLVRRQFPQQFMRILSLPQMWRNFYGHDATLAKLIWKSWPPIIYSSCASSYLLSKAGKL